MAKSAIDDLAFYGVALAAGFVGYHAAIQGHLGATAQLWAFDVDSALKGPTITCQDFMGYILPENAGKLGTCGGATTGATAAKGAAGCWDSTTDGIPACVGVKWCATHTAPPQSITDLVNWGNGAGYRKADGSWSC